MRKPHAARKQGFQRPDSTKCYALLVDGYMRDLFSLGLILQRLNYDVFIANSGEDAIKHIELAVPDLVITELSLRHMSGLELLFHLKQNAETRDIPVIIYTAIGDATRQQHCRDSGCAAFLTKPADIAQLYSAIQHATEARPRQHIRLHTLLPVRVGGPVPKEAADSVEYITEISENDFFVRTLNPRPINAVLPVNLIINSQPVKVTARVARTVTIREGVFKEPGMGMQFVEISSAHRELLRNYIRYNIMRDIVMS
ncbi:MAG TPA: response regulator [Nitrospirota bacterium]|nr:response regulator [Nitrospirota bacterium]